MQIVVRDLLINYVRTGKGKPVLLLHGWGDNSTGLSSITSQLSKDYDVIVPDLPGFGASQTPTETWGLDDYAKITAEIVNKLEVTPYAVIGHSNGGAIAVRALSNKLLNPKKLVLLGSAGIRGEYKGRTKALRVVTKSGKLITSPLPVSIKKKLRKKVYSSIGSDMLVAENLQETFKKVVTDDVRDDARKITQLTLLIYGQDDTSTPPSYGEIFRDLIVRSKLVIIKDAGHFVHLDQAGQVNDTIQDFLK